MGTQGLLLLRFALLGSASLIAALGQPLPFDPTLLHDAAQDGTGRVWAIGDSGLFYWADGKWQEQALMLPGLDTNGLKSTGRLPGAGPLLLQTNHQGSVFVFWSRSGSYQAIEAQYWITKLKGTNELISASFGAWTESANVLFHPKGTGWLTGRGPRIYRIQPDLRVELAYTISSNQMAGERFDSYNPVQAALDVEGRVWFWGQRPFLELATLRGLLAYSEEGFVHHGGIEGLPDRGFSALGILDTERLWVGVRKGDKEPGLHELDLKTMRGRRLPEPEPGAFMSITEIHPLAADCYVTSQDGRGRNAGNSLWRWRAGQWEKMLSPLDPFSTVYLRGIRPSLSEASGFWLGTAGNGALFIPHASGSPVRVCDWRMGQPLETVNRIASLKDGGLLLVGTKLGTTHARPEELLKGRSISPRVADIWRRTGNLQRDLRGHVWSVLRPHNEVESLGEWNGVEWKKHPLPDYVLKCDPYSVGLDSRERSTWRPAAVE